MPIRWLFLDLNSFFASVEQHFNPSLRGKPIAVVPMVADNTCAIAASIQAKHKGVKTGTLVRDARVMCPGIIFVEADHERYVEIHHKVIDIVQSCLPISAVMSIDEVACELIGSERTVEKSTAIALEIKRKLREQLGECITASIGISTNRFLAKVASDMKKPDGLTFIEESDLPEKLKSLSLRDFPGIGRQMEKRLLTAGIYNTELLLNSSKGELRQVWGGIVGEHFYEWLRGRDTDAGKTQQRSISHSHVLPPELRNPEGAFRVLQKLLHKAAFRLRKDQLWCRRMNVYVSFMNDEPSIEESVKMIECQDDFSLMEGLKQIWSHLQRLEIWGRGGKPLKVAVWLNDLVPDEERNLSFFDNEKGLQVSKKLDEINAKFGRGSVYFANMGESGSIAPSRIAFQVIPDFDSD